MASKSNATPTTPRTFARVTATEVKQPTQEQNDEGLFLTVITTHPEPEVGLF
jgi:hypothetical protein